MSTPESSKILFSFIYVHHGSALPACWPEVTQNSSRIMGKLSPAYDAVKPLFPAFDLSIFVDCTWTAKRAFNLLGLRTIMRPHSDIIEKPCYTFMKLRLNFCYSVPRDSHVFRYSGNRFHAIFRCKPCISQSVCWCTYRDWYFRDFSGEQPLHCTLHLLCCRSNTDMWWRLYQKAFHYLPVYTIPRDMLHKCYMTVKFRLPDGMFCGVSFAAKPLRGIWDSHQIVQYCSRFLLSCYPMPWKTGKQDRWYCRQTDRMFQSAWRSPAAWSLSYSLSTSFR